MQKIKSVLSGNNNDSVGDRTSRDYSNVTSGERSVSGTGERLTGDAGSGVARSGTTGSNNLATTGLSGTNARDSVASTGSTGLAGDHATSGLSGTGATTGSTGLTGSQAGTETAATGSSNRLTGDSNAAGYNTSSNSEGLLNRLSDKHDYGHDSALASKFDPAAESTHHDHKHLAHVTHRDVRHIETEEVSRERQHERHVHHVQHHVQPVHHQEINDEVHHEKSHPTTRIQEQHVNSDADHQLFQSLGKHKDEETHRPKERTIVDLGEKVNETVHHHVHHITQPVVKTEVHDRHRIHTTIPLHQTTHEAPIIHKSSMHEPISMADFKKGGGVLGSGVTMQNAGVLQTGECTRSVDGVGEKLAQDLHLSPSSGARATGASAASPTTSA